MYVASLPHPFTPLLVSSIAGHRSAFLMCAFALALVTNPRWQTAHPPLQRPYRRTQCPRMLPVRAECHRISTCCQTNSPPTILTRDSPKANLPGFFDSRFSLRRCLRLTFLKTLCNIKIRVFRTAPQPAGLDARSMLATDRALTSGLACLATGHAPKKTQE